MDAETPVTADTPNVVQSPPRTVLVLRLSAVGDIVLTTPAIEALKRAWPHARIVWAIKQSCAPLLRHNPYVDDIVALQPKESVWSFAQRLRAFNIDAILDVHNTLRTRVIRALLPNVGVTSVWHKRPWRDEIPVRLGWRPYHSHKPFSDRMHDAVEQLVGQGTLPHGQLRIWCSDRDMRAARDLLVQHGIDLHRPILGIAPGARWETKRWPVTRFAELAARAAQHGIQVVVTGSHSERNLGEQIRTTVPTAQLLFDELPLTLLPPMIAHCNTFVCNDSGPMHIARALGIPTLAFFGPTDPTMFDFTGHHVMRATNVACAPCHFYGRHQCPKRHFNCMHHIAVDAAWQALLPLLTTRPIPLLHA